MKTPDETVSEQITAALLQKGLITDEDSKKLSGRLAKGEVKDSEWLTLMRMGMQNEATATGTETEDKP